MTQPMHFVRGGLWRKNRTGAHVRTDEEGPVCGALIWAQYSTQRASVTCGACLEFLGEWTWKCELAFDREGQP